MRRILIFISALICCVMLCGTDTADTVKVFAADGSETVNEADNSGTDSAGDAQNEQSSSSITLDDFDFSDMEEVVGEYSDIFGDLNFKSLVNNIINNDFSEKGILNIILNTFVSAFQQNRTLIMKIILLAVFSAGLNLILPAFNQKQVSDISQIILYIALTTILAGFFYSAGKVCSDALESCLRIYKAIIPACL